MNPQRAAIDGTMMRRRKFPSRQSFGRAEATRQGMPVFDEHVSPARPAAERYYRAPSIPVGSARRPTDTIRHISLISERRVTRPQALAAIASTMGVFGHAEPMVSEYLDQARFGKSAFVIRAEPSGVPTGVGSLSIWVELVVHIRRFIKRDQTWMIRVRRSEDDPFGNVVHQEVAADEDDARKRVDEIKGEIRSGQFSWDSL